MVATLLNRRPGGAEAHIDPPREPELPHDWPEKLPFRKRPKPYSRAIRWSPGDDPAGHRRSRPYELFVSQSVLRQVRGHLITARSGEPYGFLIGQVVYCPWSESPYIVVDAVRREPQSLPPANDMDRFRHAWVAASRDARHRRGEVVGWYHRHGVLGLRLSEWDLHLQEEFFPEAWHCALIVASTPGGIIGGFIQRSPRARLFRKGLAPFHELVDLDAKLVDGRKPSFVDWENYAAGEPVSVLKAKWPSPRARLERWKAADHTTEGEPSRDRAEDAGPAARPGAGARGLRGRSWRSAPGPKKDAPRPVREDGFSEEFADVVGRRRQTDEPGQRDRAPGDAAVEEAEAPAVEGADVDDAAAESLPTKPKGRKGSGKKPSAGGRKGAGTDAGDAAAVARTGAGDAPADRPASAGEAGKDDAWYSPEFRDAAWGDPPFEPEAPEPASEDVGSSPPEETTETGRRRKSARPKPDAPKKAAGRKAARRAQPKRPRFELVTPFEPEPSEVDDSGSVEWLLSLAGDTLARGEADPGGSQGDAVAADETEAGDAGDAAEPEEARDASVDAGGERDDEPAGDETPHAEPDDGPVPTRERPGLVRPSGTRSAASRRTFVSASQNPELDREAEIPVVLFHDRRGWRPPPALLRAAAGAAIVLAGGLVWRTFSAGGPSVPPPAPAAQTRSMTQAGLPTPEFVDLADAYLTALRSYRERLTQHEAGRADCGRLAADFSLVVGTHRTLAAYVSATPSMADRFTALDAELDPARARFEASGCPAPPDLPAPGTGGA